MWISTIQRDDTRFVLLHNLVEIVVLEPFSKKLKIISCSQKYLIEFTYNVNDFKDFPFLPLLGPGILFSAILICSHELRKSRLIALNSDQELKFFHFFGAFNQPKF